MPFIALVFDPSTPPFVKNQPSNDKIKFFYKVVNDQIINDFLRRECSKNKVKNCPARFSVNLSTKDLLPMCPVR